MDTAILAKAFIYIIYPQNYDPNDINTRQFYIGSTFNITDTRLQFYRDLYRGTFEKKIMLMRDYMKTYNINIIEDKEKAEDKKLWQFRILFAGLNCCSKSLLKSLEGLYIYYYYSILNDEDITFKPANITDNEIYFADIMNLPIHYMGTIIGTLEEVHDFGSGPILESNKGTYISWDHQVEQVLDGVIYLKENSLKYLE
jgi:hypothetical protein